MCEYLDGADHLLLTASGEDLFLWDVEAGTLLAHEPPGAAMRLRDLRYGRDCVQLVTASTTGGVP